MHVCRNKFGFTLIEFLVAIVILMVGMLGLLQAVNVAIKTNLQNQLRNEALLVADKWMALELSKGYAASTGAEITVDSRRVLNGFINYSVFRNVSSITPNSKEIRFRVTWPYRGVRFTHNAGGVLSKTQ